MFSHFAVQELPMVPTLASGVADLWIRYSAIILLVNQLNFYPTTLEKIRRLDGQLDQIISDLMTILHMLYSVAYVAEIHDRIDVLFIKYIQNNTVLRVQYRMYYLESNLTILSRESDSLENTSDLLTDMNLVFAELFELPKTAFANYEALERLKWRFDQFEIEYLSPKIVRPVVRSCQFFAASAYNFAEVRDEIYHCGFKEVPLSLFPVVGKIKKIIAFDIDDTLIDFTKSAQSGQLVSLHFDALVAALKTIGDDVLVVAITARVLNQYEYDAQDCLSAKRILKALEGKLGSSLFSGIYYCGVAAQSEQEESYANSKAYALNYLWKKYFNADVQSKASIVMIDDDVNQIQECKKAGYVCIQVKNDTHHIDLLNRFINSDMPLLESENIVTRRYSC